MALEEKLKQVLAAALKTTECHLDTSATGRVGGVVIGSAFAGMSQTERQELIWKNLREQLTQGELIQIMALLTLTPEEASDLHEDSVEGP